MLDLIFIAELIWCTILLRVKGFYQSLIYAGGVLTSGYAAFQLTNWLAKRFSVPSNPAFQWLSHHLTTDSESVTTLSRFIPPESASFSQMKHTQWIAYQVMRGMMYVSISAAVFLLFVAIIYLSAAVWDRPFPHLFRFDSHMATVASAVSGTYVAVLSAVFLANLAWINTFGVIGDAVHHSLTISWIGRAIAQFHLLL
jgi:hypothetical protein